MINRQLHSHTCGPTSVANAYKFVGGKITYNEILELTRSIFPRIITEKRGIWPYQLAKLLDKLHIDYEIVLGLNQKRINKIISDGYGLIFSYSWKRDGEYGAHYTFIDKVTDHYIYTWNNSKKNKTAKMSRKLISEDLRHTAHYRPQCYKINFIIKGIK
jgi:hypothetical protein